MKANIKYLSSYLPENIITNYDLEKTLDTKVNLKLWVKVKKDWINDMSIVKKFKAED